MRNSETISPFHRLRQAVSTDHALAEMLITEDEAIVDARNSIGETVLHWFVVENEQGLVKWLIAHGACLETQNKFGDTPLIDAATLHYNGMCRLLLENGADIRAKGNHGSTAIACAVMTDRLARVVMETLELLLNWIGEDDINDFFSDLDVGLVREHSKKSVVRRLDALGLRPER